ncbi:hypothetical protein LSH36_488g02007 [Paralvinella palmiformis]|uniref:Uncharacterized protein n=1 Tax=Paralvinella palmiformis TaxID=53620 RepID=A0AAD9J9V4_9ANNE|nr:hypothetical protein LSH36_488g02007 [Paralvinella palmiformis]
MRSLHLSTLPQLHHTKDTGHLPGRPESTQQKSRPVDERHLENTDEATPIQTAYTSILTDNKELLNRI